MKAPIMIGIGSQKGGVGKSTIAELLASILYYEMDFNVLVVDCDAAQNSFYNLRVRDREVIDSGSPIGLSLYAKFQSYGKPAYTIIRAAEHMAIERAKNYCSEASDREEPYDYVLFDMPGRCDTTESLALALSMDYILSPIEADIQSLVASMTYASAIKSVQDKVPNVKLRELYLFWNKIDERVRTDAIDNYTDIMAEEGIECLESRLFYRKKFSRESGEAKDLNEIFRCTLTAPKDTQRLGTGLNEFLDELKTKGIIIQKTKTN